MTIFKTDRVTVMVFVAAMILLALEVAYRKYICPCGFSCICDPCVCGVFSK